MSRASDSESTNPAGANAGKRQPLPITLSLRGSIPNLTAGQKTFAFSLTVAARVQLTYTTCGAATWPPRWTTAWRRATTRPTGADARGRR
jgi:hypothetical protein